jgi:hypothetical protein
MTVHLYDANRARGPNATHNSTPTFARMLQGRRVLASRDPEDKAESAAPHQEIVPELVIGDGINDEYVHALRIGPPEKQQDRLCDGYQLVSEACRRS